MCIHVNLETPWILVRLLVSCILAIFGLPFFLVTSAALYSKMLPLKIQGLVCGEKFVYVNS